MKKKNIAIALGVLCMILTCGIILQMNTVKSMTKDVGTGIKDNSELIDQLIKWQDNYKKMYSKLEDAEATLEQIRAQASLSNSEDKEKELELKENNKLLGLTEVSGSGVIIKLDDNRNVKQEEIIGDINTYLVHEDDLLQIVNELFNAGADAISINDKRVISTTSILCDGNIIRVNGEIVGVPITIKAIGYPEAFYDLDRPYGYLDIMRQGGAIASLEKSDNIKISKYEGAYNYQYIN